TYNYHQLSSYPITANTVYTFNPCQKILGITGDVDNGGTAEMKLGDELLADATTLRGSGSSFYPFTLSNPDNGCGPVSYSATFTGAGAGDYSLVPGTLQIGESIAPEILFTPQ